MINVGLALCDLGVDEYSLARLVGDSYNSGEVEKLKMSGVELQLEDWEKYNILFRGKEIPTFLSDEVLQGDDLLSKAFAELREKQFKSFHCPITAGNLSSPNEKVRRQAINITLKSMDAADAFGSDVFVLHPCCYGWNYWKRFDGMFGDYMQYREVCMDIFMGVLKGLAQTYVEKGYRFNMAIENLEFNQFPATSMEIKNLLQRSNEAWQRVVPGNRIGLVFDFQHLKHSKAVLKENMEQLQYFLPPDELDQLVSYAYTPICREHDYVPPEGEILPVINQFFKDHLDDIVLIHLGGNEQKHTTHDPILYDLRTFEYKHEHYKRGMLNIRQVLDIIHFSGYDGAIILELKSENELIEERFEEMVTTLHNVEGYLRHLRESEEV